METNANDGSNIVRILIFVGGCLLLLLIVMCIVGVAGGLFFGVASTTTIEEPLEELVTAEIVPLSTPTSQPQPKSSSAEDDNQDDQQEEEPSPSSDSTAAIQATMQDIEDIVAVIRGLDELEDVPKSFLSPDELGQIVEEDFLADYTPEIAQDDTYFLASLDVVSIDFDLYGFYDELFSDGIAGFYDPETDEFFLIGSGDDFTASDEFTFAHEFIHALQDQHFDLAAFLNYDDDDWYIDEFDQAQARQALTEGDASFSSIQYLYEYMDAARQAELFADNELPEIYETAPPFLLTDFFFPYVQGTAFVGELWADGGFERIDQAYSDPPTSTEQILHPELYLDHRDEPQAVTLADTLSVLDSSYRMVYEQPIGEWYTRLYLQNQLSESKASDAAAGWDGDRYGLYVDEDTRQFVMVIRTVWDSGNESAEFLSIFSEYGERWGDPFLMDGAACYEAEDILCVRKVSSDGTVIVRAPNRDTASAVLAQYP